ncbi:hypothetical protein BDQ94DRAFT_164243 [Aspergillus welwitschiae]|uniref:Uncharacterized protein n=1 Tax=Aspergillus welwitschiae TaxID=1341132 RepID=A0A3F3PIE4_9EURO|nr:hypothetical protein BDQ94DRAFT_164243 [Aspergillus welwitschiae]RDH26710.1 hypothetical protein BDQ94DRAFT_164243 [Aspergillus welwitschiae]
MYANFQAFTTSWAYICPGFGPTFQQQQALLQRVNSRPQVEAHMSSGGTPGADSDHSGQSQAESQQRNPAVQSAQHDRVSDVAQTDHVVHVPRASQAHHEGEQNQVSQRGPHHRVSDSSQSNHIRASRQNHYQGDPNQAIQPTPSNGGSQSTQTNDVSERVQHQDEQRPAIKQDEESQNEEQQQRAPQQTRAQNNQRTITDQCLRQRGITWSTSGIVPPRSERERRRMVYLLMFLPSIMESLQQTRSASQSRVFKQE